MPRWFTLTADHLKAAGYGAIVDRAAQEATGAIDPVQEAIDNATARIQRAIAPGNILDADATKIPASFKGPAEKLAIFDLMQRIGMPLSEDEKQTQRDITSDLNRTADHKLKVEEPDTAASSGLIQPTGMTVSAVNVPRRQTGRSLTSGL